MNDDRPGPTHDYPDGKLNDADEGGLNIGISSEGINVRIDFGKPVTWIAMTHSDAIGFALLLLKHCGVTQINFEEDV